MAKKRKPKNKRKPKCTSGKSFACGFSCQPIERGGKKIKCRSNVVKGKKVVEDYVGFLKRTDPRSFLEQQLNVSRGATPSGDDMGQMLVDEIARRSKNEQSDLLNKLKTDMDTYTFNSVEMTLDFEKYAKRLEEKEAEEKRFKKRLEKDEKKFRDTMRSARKGDIEKTQEEIDFVRSQQKKLDQQLPKRDRDILALEAALKAKPPEVTPKTSDGLVDYKKIIKDARDNSKSQLQKIRDAAARVNRKADEVQDLIDQTKKMLGMDDSAENDD